MTGKKNIAALNELSMTAEHYEHTILFENQHLMDIMVHLSHLRDTTDGVFVGNKRVSWSEVLPESLGIPGMDATIKDGERWYSAISEMWAAMYNAKAQEALAKLVGKSSNIENDNLYMLTLCQTLRGMADNILPFVDVQNYKQFEPEGAKAMKDIVNGLIGITDGVITTEKVKNDIFNAGVESAIMALTEQIHLLSNQGQAVEGLKQAISIIHASQHTDITHLNNNPIAN